MRYPLTLGFLTALLATGWILNMAANNAQQRACAARQHQQEARLSQFRFDGPILEHSEYAGFIPPAYPVRTISHSTVQGAVIPTARIATNILSVPALCCSAEAAYVMETRLDQAHLFGKLGWERTSKSNGYEHYPVWTVAEKEPTSPNAGAQSQWQSDLWDCSVGYVPSEELLAGMRQASLQTSPATKTPSHDSSIVYQARRFQADWSIPSDARQADIHPGLDDVVNVAARDTISPLYHDLWQAIRSFDLAITSCDNPWQLIENAMPQQVGKGCGPTAASSVDVVTDLSLEEEILKSICQIAHIHPSQIAFDPFFSPQDSVIASATGSGVRKVYPEFAGKLIDRVALLQEQWVKLASDWAKQAEKSLHSSSIQVAAHWSTWADQYEHQQRLTQQNGAPPACWTEPVDSWSYVSEQNLPGLGYPISAWQWAELSSQIRHNRPTELARADRPADLPVLQPIPAANQLGIRNLARRVYRWFSAQTDSVIDETLAAGEKFQSWKMQQNATLERMVMQQEEGVTR